jgi:alpha-glucosidase
MTFDIFTTDWTTARKKLAGWQPIERATDIFEGAAHCESAQIEGVTVTRLCIRPQAKTGLAKISQSFAVSLETEWQNQSIEKTQLSFGLTWLQANAGRFDFHFDMPAQLRCLGLGERFSNLNLRGTKHTLFATDNPHHNEHADMLYKSIPFLILADRAKYTGIFVDSPAPQRWDLDTEMISQGKIELFTRRGFYLYTFETCSLAELVRAFTGLTGRAPLPPRWSLGHQQCRWSYPDEATIRELASQFRSRKIPCDTLVLDIDYMDEYRVFTYSKERFPSFPKLAQELKKDNFNLITIVDPGVKKDEKYQIYRQGVGQKLFCKTARGEVFVETVWPGISAFPDFLKKETRLWWQENLKFYIDNGMAGIWNDMNEPAMFNSQRPLPEPLIEMPEDNKQLFLQEGEDGPVGHFEVRNLYGFLMSLATRDALAQYRPGERPFVLTRAASTGIQRHAAVWLGDNTSWYEHLQKSLPMLLNIGLSGVPFAGVDIGGFAGDTTPELLVRWYEIGIFYPFFRNHCALMGRAQEPFSFSAPVEAMVRHLIEMRYRLLPYIQGLFWQHTRSGAPLMRPLAWHYDDEMSLTCDDQFMFGPDIMVAPILAGNQRSRYVYFPEGKWYSFDDQYIDLESSNTSAPQAIVGGQTLRIECPLGRVPAFVRDGAVIALADVMQSTHEYDSSAITFYAFGEKADGKYFEDDGRSIDYQNGRFSEWEIAVSGNRFTSRAVRRQLEAVGERYFFKSFMNLESTQIELS